MSYEPRSQYQIALEDFRRARRHAAASEILRRLRGQPVDLLPFDEVWQHIKSQGSFKRGRQRIPIDAIVGSVGRYTEFTRDFLPRSRSLQKRWARVKTTFQNLEDMPPIQVYQIGEVYFVLDGNHRVSIARERGATEINAYVTEVLTNIHITPEINLDSLILKAEHADFLERTHLDDLQPPPELTITVPGRYQLIERQIALLRKQEKEKPHVDISYPEAAKIWYREIYQPIVEIIRAHNLLRDFPERTETDLFVWISQHQENLRQNLGWKIDPEDAAIDLADQYSSRPERISARWEDRIHQVTPYPIEPGLKPGEWRRQQLSSSRREKLFGRILVPISGEPHSWEALQQATLFAQREQSHLLGLHIVPKDKQRNTEKTKAIQTQFARICQEAKCTGEMAIDVGKITPTIRQRARWSDLIVVHLAHPPSQQPLKRLGPGFHRLVQVSPRPILAVPQSSPSLNNLLLAYDGSPRADEALFIAAYLAGKWNLPLTVLVILDSDTFPKKAIARARWYLNLHKIRGDIHIRTGAIAETILKTAQDHNSDLIIMGGYSHPPMLEVVLGSAVNQVLRTTKRPVLICH